MSHIIPAEFYVGDVKLPVTAFQSVPLLESMGVHLIREDLDPSPSLDDLVPESGEVIMKVKRGEETDKIRITFDRRFHTLWCGPCRYNVVSLDEPAPALSEETITLVVKDMRRVG